VSPAQNCNPMLKFHPMKHGDTIASPLWVGFDGKSLPPSLSRWLAGGQVGGVVLYARNIEGLAQVRGLCREIRAAATPSR
jgi:hypothetical protein